jgi:hypothetical protein
MTGSSKSDWTAAFLQALAEGATITTAAKAAGVGRASAYDRRKWDKEFAAAWDSAVEEATDELEAIAWKRAAEYSDQLLIFMLRAARPEKFKEKTQVETVTFDPDSARDALRQKLERLFAGDAAEAQKKC